MECYSCGCRLSEKDFCTGCGADVAEYKKVMYLSNQYYNEGLEKAQVRDLSGAIASLRQSLKLNKNNTNARNLLGLVYFEMGEVVAALSEWVISKNLQPNKNLLMNKCLISLLCKHYEVEDKKIQGYKMSIFGAPIPFVTYNIKF